MDNKTRLFCDNCIDYTESTQRICPSDPFYFNKLLLNCADCKKSIFIFFDKIFIVFDDSYDSIYVRINKLKKIWLEHNTRGYCCDNLLPFLVNLIRVHELVLHIVDTFMKNVNDKPIYSNNTFMDSYISKGIFDHIYSISWIQFDEFMKSNFVTFDKYIKEKYIEDNEDNEHFCLYSNLSVNYNIYDVSNDRFCITIRSLLLQIKDKKNIGLIAYIGKQKLEKIQIICLEYENIIELVHFIIRVTLSDVDSILNKYIVSNYMNIVGRMQLKYIDTKIPKELYQNQQVSNKEDIIENEFFLS